MREAKRAAGVTRGRNGARGVMCVSIAATAYSSPALLPRRKRRIPADRWIVDALQPLAHILPYFIALLVITHL